MARKIGGKTYLSLPEAADRLGVSRVTVWNWVKSRMDDLDVDVLRDPLSGHYFIEAQSVKRLTQRYEKVTA